MRLPLLLAACSAAVAAPSAAAVAIPGANPTARLAVGPSGDVWSAYVVDNSLWVVRPDSRALPTPVARLPGSGGVVAGIDATRGTATLLWRRAPDDWFGRFLFANSLGIAAGPVFASADTTAVYATWTVDYPTFGERHVVLARANGRARSTVLSRAGSAAAVTVGSTGPEVALNESVGPGLVAGVIAREDGSKVEIDGRLLDLQAQGLQRHLLVAGPDGAVSWYSSRSPLSVRVSLAARRSGSAVVLEGRVEGVAGGSVSVYREVSGGSRQLVADAPLAPDGSFAASDESPPLPSHYRAVYSEPGTGIPFAALLRSPVG